MSRDRLIFLKKKQKQMSFTEFYRVLPRFA